MSYIYSEDLTEAQSEENQKSSQMSHIYSENPYETQFQEIQELFDEDTSYATTAISLLHDIVFELFYIGTTIFDSLSNRMNDKKLIKKYSQYTMEQILTKNK